MDARNWGTHGTGFLEIADRANVPLGDRIHCVKGNIGTTELVNRGKYLVIECEAGNYRVRTGKLQAHVIGAGGTPFFGNAVTPLNWPSTYATGDGPIYPSPGVMLTGNPFVDVLASSGKIISYGNNWVADGWSGVGLFAVDTRPGGGVNNGTAIVTGISSTNFVNDTLNMLSFTLVDELLIQGAFIYAGFMPANIPFWTPLWAINTGSEIKVASTQANALAGIPIIPSDAGSNTCILGGDQGPYQLAGFSPFSPSGNTIRGEGEKLLREGELIISSARHVTVRAQGGPATLKWWSIG